MSKHRTLEVYLEIPDDHEDSCFDTIENAIHQFEAVIGTNWVARLPSETETDEYKRMPTSIPQDCTICASCGAKHPLKVPYAWGYRPPHTPAESNERWCDSCFKSWKKTGELP